MSIMNINKLVFRNFKTLENVSFEPGRVNVFIGANGSGKTTVLEAIGLLCAAMTDRIDNSSMQRKGIRLSVPGLYKSAFSDLKRKAPTINFDVSWSQNEKNYQYAVNLNVPNESDSARRDMWRYHSEKLTVNNETVWGRSGASKTTYDPYVGLLMLEPNEELAEVRTEIEKFKNYAIYQPNTQALRGTLPDPYQVNPIGLCGGRLAEAIEEIIRKDEDDESYLQDLPLDDVLELIDWASGFDVASPKKSSVNAAVPTSRRILEFQDRYLTSKTSFTAYDASEGALYVLFLLCLALHPDAPSIFAVDSFDHAMHPRLARETTRLFCKTILEQDKTVFVTTHNPLVLDGLDLMNDDIRLFAVNKSRKSGHTTLQRIQITKELMDSGYSLSRLWTEGRLGGVPNL
mgnify:FL=1